MAQLLFSGCRDKVPDLKLKVYLAPSLRKFQFMVGSKAEWQGKQESHSGNSSWLEEDSKATKGP